MVDQSEGISQNAVWSPNMTAFSSGAKATPHGLLSSYIPLIMGAQVQFNQSDPEPLTRHRRSARVSSIRLSTHQQLKVTFWNHGSWIPLISSTARCFCP